MLTRFFPKSIGTPYLYRILGALIVSAWILLIAWQRSPYADLLGHEALADHHIPFTSHLGAFLLSWLLMTAAMMLPANLPTLIHSQSNGRGDYLSAARIVTGYFSPWFVFGILMFLGDNVLHEMTEPGAPLAAASAFIAPAIILAAGIYQLTPYKRRFTERCKLLKEHALQGRGAIKHGLWLGINCIGSCWSLMLLMFALGHHRLGWMVILSSIITAERLTPWGSRLARWVGFGLILWAVTLVGGIL